MSLHDCITNAQNEGFLSREEAERLHNTHRRNRAAQGGLGLDDAEAARATFDAFEHETMQRRRQKLLAAASQQQIAFDIRGYRNERGDAKLVNGGRALFDSSAFGAKTPGADQLREAIRGRLHSTMARAFEMFERDLAGNTRNKATLSDVVDALFGSSHVSEAAHEIAEGWKLTAERARQMFNEAGGNIGYREDWGLPQGHDAESIAAAGFETWRDFVGPLLDRTKMIDGMTGQAISDQNLELALFDAWKAITTDGWSRRPASSASRGTSIANKRADPRFLVFKDGEGWRSYMNRFGEGDPFKVMNNYIDGMSRDISLMQRFGPNPTGGVEYAKQLMTREAALASDPGLKNGVRKATAEMDTMYEHMTGAAAVPGDKAMASWAGEIRQWLVSTQLGAAMLGAVTDIGFQQVTAAMNGIPGWRVLAKHAALMIPTNGADRETAISLGLIADEAAQVMATQQRHYGEAWGSGLAKRFADGTLRASGLGAWTQAGRWAFGMEFLSYLARHSDLAHGDLPAILKGTLDRYGFNEGHWNDLKAAVIDKAGARFIQPNLIADEKLSLKLLAMVRSETHFAVPSTSLYGRAALGGSLRPGTISGELFRSFLMYKNFGVTVLMTHGRRAAMQTTWRGKLGYGGALLASTTLLGALALQMKEISKGRDARPMGDSEGWPVPGMKFTAAAMLQGGGLGLFGDFLFAQQNRFGGNLQGSVAGPVIGAFADVGTEGWNVINGRAKASDLVHLAERYTPGGSLWYARLAYQRMILDQVREMVDPDAGDYQRRLMKNYKTTYAQNYWWKAGAPLPQRAPDMAEGLAPEVPNKPLKRHH